MTELVAAIDAYFKTVEWAANWRHSCQCSGCSAEKDALGEVLKALRDQEDWKQRLTEVD